MESGQIETTVPNVNNEDFYSEEQMFEVLDIKQSTLLLLIYMCESSVLN